MAAGVFVLLLAACAPDGTGAVAWDHAVLRADGRTIDVEVGMTPEGDGPCEVRYDQRVVERAERVTVAFVPRPKPWWRRIPLGGCTAEGVPQHLTVRLAAALGDREVYDGAQRAPRPVHREVDVVEVTTLPPGFGG